MSKKKNLRKKLLIVLISILAFIAVIIGVFFLTPFFEQVQVYTAQDSADWMKNIDDDVLISDISIPGTHDSGSAYVQYAFIFRCQALTISQQLEAGFRYLDVRLRTDGNDLVFCHSFAFCKENGGLTSKNLSLESVLEDIYSFLENHPSETVIFVAKSEYSDDDIGLFQSTFNSIINKNADKWLFSETIPTLGEARGKIVLYRRYSDSSISTLSGTYINWGDQGYWTEPSNSMSIENKGGFDIAIQDHYKFSKDDKKIAIQAGFETARSLVGKNTIRINFLSTTGKNGISHPAAVSRELNNYIKETKPTGNVGWVIFDFGDAELASMIYSLNY